MYTVTVGIVSGIVDS